MKNIDYRKKLIQNNEKLSKEDIMELKKMYHIHNKQFVSIIKSILKKIKQKNDISTFFFICDNFNSEITDIAPFLSDQISNIVKILIDNGYFKKLVDMEKIIIESCKPNIIYKLNEVLLNKDILKFITTLDTYRIKKMIFEISQKYNKKDIVNRIDAELKEMDINWVDIIED